MGPVGTGDWGLGLGLDNECHFYHPYNQIIKLLQLNMQKIPLTLKPGICIFNSIP